MPDSRPPRPSRRHITVLVLMIVIATGGGLAGIVWYEDRPLTQAEAAYRSGDYALAAETLQEFLRDHPDDVRAQSLQARILVAVGRFDQAIALYESLGPSEPDDVHAWAQALLRRQRWGEALPLLEYLSTVRPEDPDVLHELSACRAKLGLYEPALEAARRFAALPGHEARGHLLLGTIHQEMGNVSSAAAAYGQVLNYQPDADDLQVPAHEFFREYGRLLIHDGRPAAARSALERSLEEGESSETWSLYGEALLALGEADAAVDAWRKAVSLDPRETAPRADLANRALQEQRAEEALQWLEPLKSSEELSSSIAYLFQRAHLMLGRDDQAEEWRVRTEELRNREELRQAMDQVLVNAPESMWAWVIRAYRFAEQGNWDQAAQSLEPVSRQIESEPFVSRLAEAIAQRGPLPPVEDLPIERH